MIDSKFTIIVTSEGREGGKGGTVQPTLGTGMGSSITFVLQVSTNKVVHQSPEGEGLFPKLMGDMESKVKTWTVVHLPFFGT